MAQPNWITTAGTLGTYPSMVPFYIQLSAAPVTPATSLTYTLLSGSLPTGVTIDSTGLISGIPLQVIEETISAFAVRITDNLNNIRDRTFSLTVSGLDSPQFVTAPGNILSSLDSIWIELPIEYYNPIESNPIVIKLIEGFLPPGLEINDLGMIRGYASPPVVNITLPTVNTTATATQTTNIITCTSTAGFTLGRPVLFTTSPFGGLETGTTYYIKSIESTGTGFSVSTTQNGPTLSLTQADGFMGVTLPAISIGQPTTRTYAFSLKLESPLGTDIASYSITITNQNYSGSGKLPNTRNPAIFNTRPPTFIISGADPYYGYYIIPPAESTELTILPGTPAFIGTAQSDNYFSFKIIGHDFDGDAVTYQFSNLPLGLTTELSGGKSNTGWVTGTPVLNTTGINRYTFGVEVYKNKDRNLSSGLYQFGFNVANNLSGDIIWETTNSLGTIFNSTISTKRVIALCETELMYRITSGSLPPNLTLLSNGEITGYVASQPTTELLAQGAETVFTFTIQAFSPKYPVIQSSKTFTLTVVQEYAKPTDVLYIKATPSVADRVLIDSLLDNSDIFPESYLYRPYDQYFGKATSVIYEHAYGIYANDINNYLAAVTKNHYWRNITLGELETAVAKDENGDILYEVVYSKVIDNLINPKGVSVSEQIDWPRSIDLGLGPWYTSITNIYTSYVELLGQQYYTSLTPGQARTLYPNSLYNMRTRVAQTLGQEYDSKLLPLWMTSQQENGSTLGYTQAWVICYTKPGLSSVVKANIDAIWPYKLNMINFKIDRFSVDKSLTYNWDNNFTPPSWTALPSATPVPDPLDSKDFYVLFPRQTILPDENEY